MNVQADLKGVQIVASRPVNVRVELSHALTCADDVHLLLRWHLVLWGRFAFGRISAKTSRCFSILITNKLR